MARRPFPVFVLSTGVGIILFAVLQPLFAQSPDDTAKAGDPPPFPKVEVELSAGGPPVEGKLKLPLVEVEKGKPKLKLSPIEVGVATGTNAIEMPHVRRITFQKDPAGKSDDSVQLADKSVVHGRVKVKDDTFTVETAEGDRVLKRAEVREIRVLIPEDHSILALALGLLTLTAMEIILGIDNVIFLAIVAGKLPEEQRPKARNIGLAAALGTRIVLLFSLSFLLGLTAPLFTLPELGFLRDTDAREVSWRDIILLAGGLFLIGKSTFEMHEKMEHAKAEREGQPAGGAAAKATSFAKVIVTIAIIDIVFSLDSVITAVGMVDSLPVMVIAMVIAMLVMLYFAGPISRFVETHPTLKVLALSFLILIGVMLVAEGLGQHINKGYIYAAMSFALVVEMVNMKLRGPAKHGDKKPAEPPPTK